MKLLLALLMISTTTPLAARDLVVPVDKGWMHAETGVVLRPQLAGLARTALADATQSERDVSAQFEAPDKSVVATIYIFRPAIADVGLWFDRSRTALEDRSTFKNAAPTTADPVTFAAGGSSSPSSLRQVYASAGGPFRSTALAVVPVGTWIVAIRMSAANLTAGELDAGSCRRSARSNGRRRPAPRPSRRRRRRAPHQWPSRRPSRSSPADRTC